MFAANCLQLKLILMAKRHMLGWHILISFIIFFWTNWKLQISRLISAKYCNMHLPRIRTFSHIITVSLLYLNELEITPYNLSHLVHIQISSITPKILKPWSNHDSCFSFGCLYSFLIQNSLSSFFVPWEGLCGDQARCFVKHPAS